MSALNPQTWWRHLAGSMSRSGRVLVGLQLAVYKLALVLVLTAASFNGGPVEEFEDSVETLKEIGSYSLSGRTPAAKRGRVARSFGSLTPSAVPSPASGGPAIGHTNHSLPNGLRAPLRC